VHGPGEQAWLSSIGERTRVLNARLGDDVVGAIAGGLFASDEVAANVLMALTRAALTRAQER
jgi:hypothetical protein